MKLVKNTAEPVKPSILEMKISFLQNVTGYGGVDILWSKCIDPLVKVFKEGISRIQCIELKTNIPILCISTYLPSKVENDRYEEYSECIDQIFEIIQKYQNSHEIVIGGDFNENISKNNNSRRASKLKELITDCDFKSIFMVLHL